MSTNNTFWEKDGNKINLSDLLNISSHLPEKNISIKELIPYLLSWDNNLQEQTKIQAANLKYPILILVDDKQNIIYILDGHHRIHKAITKNLITIKAKLIQFNLLPNEFKNVFVPAD